MLKGLDTDILKVIQDIIKMKIKHKESYLIVVEDVKNIINSENKSVMVNDGNVISTGAAISTDVDYHSSLQHFHNILFDPTSNINTGEGIKGYTALFRNRFEKSLRILALRPDSKRITKIASLKDRANNAKLGGLYNQKGNPGTRSSIVAGL